MKLPVIRFFPFEITIPKKIPVSNGQKIVNVALKEEGYKESPKNSNNTKYGEWFGFNRVAWCGIFVSWVYSKSGFELPKIGFSKGFAGCATAYTYFKKNNWITKEPIAGDIVLFNWNGDSIYDHTGIFIKWLDRTAGTFLSIEGNTGIGNESNGGQVMVRERQKLSVVFAHYKKLDDERAV